MSEQLSLRTARNQAGISLTELARRSGVSRGYLYLIENGKNSPTMKIVNQLADALNISPNVLWDEEIGEITMSVTTDEAHIIELLRCEDYASLLEFVAKQMRVG